MWKNFRALGAHVVVWWSILCTWTATLDALPPSELFYTRWCAILTLITPPRLFFRRFLIDLCSRLASREGAIYRDCLIKFLFLMTSLLSVVALLGQNCKIFIPRRKESIQSRWHESKCVCIKRTVRLGIIYTLGVPVLCPVFQKLYYRAPTQLCAPGPPHA